MNIARTIADGLLVFAAAVVGTCLCWWFVRATKRMRAWARRRYWQWRWRDRVYRSRTYADP